jgi:ABC-2 type transport system ATP-binding protein
MQTTAPDLAIDVRGMTKRFGALVAVDNIDLQVPRGTICGFLGPNGSGKTTFIRMLCGLLRADAGNGTCLGFDVIRQSEQIKRQVGYMTQKFSFYEDLTIAENLDFVARMYSVPNRVKTVQESLDRLGLASRQRQQAGTLSGGWKQRLALAACMLHEPQLLLLDEPTAGVDPQARRDFWEQIHELAAQGLTFLIATHYMDEAERCHRLAYIGYGKLLVQGSLAEVIAEAHLTTWAVSGPDLLSLRDQLRAHPEVTQAVPFGNTLHVSGDDDARLQQIIAPYRHAPYVWRAIDSSLEDAFMLYMNRALAAKEKRDAA